MVPCNTANLLIGELIITSFADYTVRKLRSDELPVVCSWAYKENWLISEDAVQCAYETDSEGAFVAVSSSGELIGKIIFRK